MTGQRYTLTLPEEPPVGAVATILNGQNKGTRFRRVQPEPLGWKMLGPFGDGRPAESWSSVWWSVTEDGSGGDQVEVAIPDPNDPYPLPWQIERGAVVDRDGSTVPASEIVRRANAVTFHGESSSDVWQFDQRGIP